MSRLPCLGTTVAVAALVSLAAATPARAGALVAEAECPDRALSQVFKPWADPMNYTLAPNGGMEWGGGWRHEGSGRVRDQEPWRVRHHGDESALELPDGSRATSRAMCVGLTEPTLRFFAKRLNGAVTSLLQVEVLFEDAGGDIRSLPIAFVANLGAWQPTAPYPLLVNLLPLLTGGGTPVAFRFTPRGDADWRIDDVYVDPWRRH